MLYDMQVDVLIASSVFAVAGLAILSLFVWEQARALVAVRHRIYERLAALTTQSRFFANPLAISRTISRNHNEESFLIVRRS